MNQPVRSISASACASFLSVLIRRPGGVGGAARIHAHHGKILHRKCAVQMRRERAALQSDTSKLATEPLQRRRDHLRMRVDHASPHDFARFVHNTNRRLLATDIQSCKHRHRCSPFVVSESPAIGSPRSPERSNFMYGMYKSAASTWGDHDRDPFQRGTSRPFYRRSWDSVRSGCSSLETRTNNEPAMTDPSRLWIAGKTGRRHPLHHDLERSRPATQHAVEPITRLRATALVAVRQRVVQVDAAPAAKRLGIE